MIRADLDPLRLSDLLGAPVLEAGRRIGYVIDARFVLDGAPSPSLAGARLMGLVIGPRRRMVLLGYERRKVRAPAPIGRFLAWRERGAHLVAAEDLVIFEHGELTVRAGHRRWSATLRA